MIFNNIHKRLQFTVELEKNRSFLRFIS